MRDRILGGTKSEPAEAVKPTCPYLGLAHDQFGHLPEPSSEHRCYLYMQRERIDQSHQERFCLTTNYLSCPWMMVSPAAAAMDDSPWRRFTESLRERFDEMERVTMRNRWPRAFVAVLIFIGQLAVAGVVEAWRIVGPTLRPILASLWIEIQAGVTRAWSSVRGRRFQAPSIPIRPRVPGRSEVSTTQQTEPIEALGAQSSLGSGVDEPAPANGVHAAQAAEVPRMPSTTHAVIPGMKWECVNCFTFNPPSMTFCQQCGRLSSRIEEELLAKEDFFTLDGLKALMGGDEEGAHRYFTLATQANPHSELAWRWRCRTVASLDEVIASLEQMVRAVPESQEARDDLELAKLRRDREQALAAARLAAQEAEKAPPGPSVLSRSVAVVRRLALEFASIPAFALGLLWLGKPVLDALAMIGFYALRTTMPVFQLPNITVQLPPALVEPLLPSTLSVADVVPIILAVWYFMLSFGVTDGSTSGRYAAIVSGLLSLLALRFVAANGELFFLCAALLFVLAVVGKGSSTDELLGTHAMTARVA